MFACNAEPNALKDSLFHLTVHILFTVKRRKAGPEKRKRRNLLQLFHILHGHLSQSLERASQGNLSQRVRQNKRILNEYSERDRKTAEKWGDGTNELANEHVVEQ